MKKNYTSLWSAAFIALILFIVFYSMMPQSAVSRNAPLSEFSTQRALQHIKVIAEEPHFVGSENHSEVAGYIEGELQALGLETFRQQGTTLTDWGNLVKSTNILARIKGTANGKALLLLSHYDSAPHSGSYGAADDASGVAVILESVRAFINNKTPHTNDIIILFSDAEELGLNGAALFVTESKWAAEVGMAINFEARGTAGPGYMLMEVNEGNAAMVDGFAEANTPFPVASSLMYSIYKMLPNDTDLTVFREQGKIQGLNFAFIDDHFNYHTAQDDFNHLSPKSVAHQGSYLMPLLKYFANANLSQLNTTDDDVYFNVPFFFIHYPFGWIWPMLVVAFLLFLGLVFVGLGKRILNGAEIGRGFALLFGSLIVGAGAAFLGWQALLALYPHYADILHGFTYNGHAYIIAFIALVLAVLFLFYRFSRTTLLNINHMVAPLLLWLLINLGIAIYLPGAGFFIIPIFFALLMFGFSIVTQKKNSLFNNLMSVPALCIFVPLIFMFPVGLGLKVIAGSAAVTVLVFTLLLPNFGAFARKGLWSLLSLLVSIGFFLYAHFNSGYEIGKARPNSLFYIYDADADEAHWVTYDERLDEWTKTFIPEAIPVKSNLANLQLFSKYNSVFTYTSEALVRNLPEPTIEFLRDSVLNGHRYLHIRIAPNRKVNRYDIFADGALQIHNLEANGAKPLGQTGSKLVRRNRKILSYYVVANEPLDLKFSIPENSKFEMELLESSFDLMTNPLFEMKKRNADRMPKPFVLNDAISIRKNINPGTSVINVSKNFTLSRGRINDTIPDPDAPDILE